MSAPYRGDSEIGPAPIPGAWRDIFPPGHAGLRSRDDARNREKKGPVCRGGVGSKGWTLWTDLPRGAGGGLSKQRMASALVVTGNHTHDRVFACPRENDTTDGYGGEKLGIKSVPQKAYTLANTDAIQRVSSKIAKKTYITGGYWVFESEGSGVSRKGRSVLQV